MKKVLIFTLLFVLIISGGALAQERANIGFEFGSNYLIPTEDNIDSGASKIFNLNFKLDNSMEIGYYRETGTVGNNTNIDINAVQVKNRINDILDTGVRFGSAGPPAGALDVYSGVFVEYTPLSNESTNFTGDLNINLGYDMLPGGVSDLFKVGVSSSITF